MLQSNTYKLKVSEQKKCAYEVKKQIFEITKDSTCSSMHKKINYILNKDRALEGMEVQPQARSCK